MCQGAEKTARGTQERHFGCHRESNKMNTKGNTSIGLKTRELTREIVVGCTVKGSSSACHLSFTKDYAQDRRGGGRGGGAPKAKTMKRQGSCDKGDHQGGGQLRKDCTKL